MRGTTVLPVRGENFVDWWQNRLVPDMQGNFDFLGGMLDHEDDLSHMDGPVLLTKIAGLVTNAGGLT
ncbi:MAG TPA: hypothetical protein VK992_01000, partial [Candidatus Caenarcaniphilales bacterium]|nr:hypothetical protein [Candidatus Caenarcaniphilales bacterium]